MSPNSPAVSAPAPATNPLSRRRDTDARQTTAAASDDATISVTRHLTLT